MNWKQWLGLAVILLYLGIPWAFVKSLVYLIGGSPRHAIVEWVVIPVNFLELYTVRLPDMFSNSVLYGLGGLVVTLGVPILGIWLLTRKRKSRIDSLVRERSG